ncbi:MAG: hypothetical protein WBQ41_09415 [Solirubrobacterales bacterium]
MSSMRLSRALPAVMAAALLALLAGCGSDSSGGSSSATQVSIPSPTSPIPTTSTPSTAAAGGQKKKQKEGQTTTTPAAPAGCTVPDAYQHFKYTGIDCTAAVAVATAWDQNGKTCNTVDNPESPIGPQRTCSVNGFSCTAKRDIHSDARFVTCTQGGQSIRFTWLPA